jgi:D-xylonolactonase
LPQPTPETAACNKIEEEPLYVADSVERCTNQYDYEEESGKVRNRKVLIRVAGSEGLPHGLRVDPAGHLWSAQWYASCVVTYDPDGKVERRIEIPAKQVSSLTFGGSKLSTLFVTTARQSEPMPVVPAGYDSVQGFFGGPLYRLEGEIVGLVDLEADIQL